MKPFDWNAVWQKVAVGVITFAIIAAIGLVYTTYSQAQETPARVDTLETRMDTVETDVSHLDSLVAVINQKMQADSVTQGAILKGINTLIGIAEAEKEKDEG